MAECYRKKSNSYQKSYPGCMGRMVSLFDLNLGVSTNKLLTEKPHQDGSDLSRNHPELSRKQWHPSEKHIEEKPVSHESRSSSNHVANGTPMKMLLAQEMSKEGDSKRKPPNVVARLMGLDAIPAHEPFSSGQRNKCESYSKRAAMKSHEEHYYLPIQLGIRQQQQRNGSKEKHVAPTTHSRSTFYEEEECKDVYEVRQSSLKERINNQSLQKATHNDHPDENKMDLVRKKFMEAKRLATDERLRGSKEFQDALEVLSSNKELFLKFLQESNSLFSKHLNGMQSLQSIPSPPQSKWITVLKPSKAAPENSSCKQQRNGERFIASELRNDRLSRNKDMVNESTKKQQLLDAKGLNENELPWSSTFDHLSSSHVRPPGRSHHLSRPTRIVVLKPSPQKAEDTRTPVASPPLSPMPHSIISYTSSPEKFSDAISDYNKDLYLRETTRHRHESISSHSLHASSAREEPLLSSVLSNGYVGDESSHSRSESETIEGDIVSDSEVMTPISRYSWDFINRCSSHSSSSISRASYSPESSVSKEAKKRLSERWALMAHGNQERQLGRSSSTLGEMLSIPEVKRQTGSVGEISEEVASMSSSRSHAENEGHNSTSIGAWKSTDGIEDGSPDRSMLRSRSVPSSRTFDTVHMEDEAKPEKLRSTLKVEKPKNGISLKGKVSSLFFSMTKKSSEEKCDPAPSIQKCQEGKYIDVVMSAEQGAGPSLVPNSHESGTAYGSSSPVSGLKGGCTLEVILSQREPRSEENLCENQEQPSPVSVLEPPFEDESPNTLGMESTISASQGINRVSLLDSWDDPILEDYRGKERDEAPGVAVDELNQFLFMQKVISAAGLDRECPKVAAICDHWYSSNYPLDPSLLERLNEEDRDFGSNNTKDSPSEAIKRQRTELERRLLFDCINAVLFDMGRHTLDVNPWLRTRSSTRKGMVLGGSELIEEVWRRLKMIFVFEGVVVAGSALADRDSVHKLLSIELDSTSWHWMDLQLVDFGSEIENGVLNDLLEDAISDIIH